MLSAHNFLICSTNSWDTLFVLHPLFLSIFTFCPFSNPSNCTPGSSKISVPLSPAVFENLRDAIFVFSGRFISFPTRYWKPQRNRLVPHQALYRSQQNYFSKFSCCHHIVHAAFFLQTKHLLIFITYICSSLKRQRLI